MSIASGYAQSPSGWISGVVTPVIAVILGWFLYRVSNRADRMSDRADQMREETKKQMEKIAEDSSEKIKLVSDTLEKQNDVLAAASQALAVLVTQVAPMHDRIIILESGNHTLETNYQLLKQALNSHEKWAEQTANRIDAQIEKDKTSRKRRK